MTTAAAPVHQVIRYGFYLYLLILAFAYLVHNSDFGMDDSYITYRYADNLKHGYGLVFNVGERHYGSTAMGFAMVLAGLSLVLERVLSVLQSAVGGHLTAYAEIPWVAKYLSATGLALTLVVWAKVLAHSYDDAKAWLLLGVSATYVFISRPANMAAGHETYTFIALLFLTSYLVFYQRHYLTGGACLAVSTMMRPDSFLFFLLVASALTYEEVLTSSTRRLSRLAVFMTPYLVLVAGWVLFLWLYVGTPIPTTMVAKKAQVYLGYWPIFRFKVVFLELVAGFPVGLLGFLILIFAVLLPIGLARLYQSERRATMSRPDALHAIVWILFAIGIILAYRSFRVTYWPWYLIPVQFTLLFLGLCTVAYSMKELLDDGGAKSKIVGWMAGALVLSAVAIDSRDIAHGVRTFLGEKHIHLHIFSYDPIIDYLRREEPNGTVVATAEPGNLGYKLGRKFTIVDELGLASPNVASHIIAGDLDYPFLRWRPKYVVVSFLDRFNPHQRCWFSSTYRLVGEFSHQYWQQHLGRGAYLYVRSGPPEALEKAIGCNGLDAPSSPDTDRR